MCLAPNYLPNPWYFGIGKHREEMEKRYPYWFLHDTTNIMMRVPCGVCSECLQNRQNEFVQRCYMLMKYSYTLFGTLTYQNSQIPWIKVNGRQIKFADIRDFQLFIHRLRKSGILPDFRYLCVTEYGDDKVLEDGSIRKSKHRPHFHFLIFIPYRYDSKDKYQVDNYAGYEYASAVEQFISGSNGWIRNYGDSRNALNFGLSRFIKSPNSYTYDCHYVTGVGDNKVTYYVTKYVLKFSDYVNKLQSALRLNLPEDEYFRVWSIIRPKLLVSKGLGIKQITGCDWPAQYVDECIDKDLSEQIDFACLNGSEVANINIEGKQYPLCDYYKKRLMTQQQRVTLHNNKYEAGPFEDETNDMEVPMEDYRNEFEKQKEKQIKFNYLQKRLQNNLY